MTPVAAVLGVNDPMEDIMKKFEKTNTYFLPVVDVDNHLIGFVSRTRIYNMYRKMVADFSAE
jgi:CIC family chloride channel protein